MLYLLANTPNQTAYMTLSEGRLLYGDCTNYLLELRNELTTKVLYVIPTILNENERVTTLLISTDTDDPTQGFVSITASARYSYKVYGQNSETNLDPYDVSVLGLYEQGYIDVPFTQNSYDQQTFVIPSDIEYNG